MTTFSIASIDELHLRGALAERRLMHGRAVRRGDEIEADDARDDALVAACQRAIDALRAAAPPEGRVRLVARATADGVEASMTIEIGGLSIVTTAEFARADAAMLRALVAAPPAAHAVPSLPMAWQNGSAAVLLHEAIGHPLELDAPPVQWPAWLRIDCPIAPRRASFRDVPLRRMTRLVVAHEGAPFTLPERRIDVHLVRGGAYDPLTDVVAIDVAIADAAGVRLPPFTIRATRERIARALVGARGAPLRYPGVVCSREGQELVVGSFAPLMITAELT